MSIRKKLQAFKILIIIFTIIGVIFISGCTEKQRKDIKHMKSDLIGLKRVVTLYNNNGKILKQWKGRFKIEVQGNYLSFIDDNNKEVKISGTIVVQEL